MATRDLVETLAGNAPLSLKSAKQQIVARCADVEQCAIREGAPWDEEAFRSRDFQEGTFFAKRKPIFAGE